MPHNPNRRSFLKGGFNSSVEMRPFGALPDSVFFDTCARCGDCGPACPESIIEFDSDGFPKVDFKAGKCTFCGECIDVCEPEALRRDQDWAWKASVESGCLSLNSVQCRTCQDFCDHGAIRFQLRTGGRAQPVLDADLCTGCGGCAASCPVDAISFEHPPQKPTQQMETCA
ncbi:ferredoxin-type protein NapF [Primorskyibacter sp. S87]|uniref:ferredoxin-type protein NapF n=1 Tax=Primorskyibacter sp. S87 TaxID=3415126 RepID=UPI003C79B460